MSKHGDDHHFEEFTDVTRRLRDARPEASALELDRMKMRAMAQARAPRAKGSALKSRIVVGLCTMGLLAGTTGGVIAKNGNSGSKGSAAQSQYKPGKGCGKPGEHTGAPGQNKKGNSKPCPPQAGKKK
jgi:hypothetical protein